MILRLYSLQKNEICIIFLELNKQCFRTIIHTIYTKHLNDLHILVV